MGPARPGDSLADLIEAAVERVLAEHKGRSHAVPGPLLVAEVRGHLRRVGQGAHVSDLSLRRRVQEAVSRLRAAGVPVGSSSDAGYWLVLPTESRAEAMRDLLARLRGLVKTARALDAGLADRLQLALDLGGEP